MGVTLREMGRPERILIADFEDFRGFQKAALPSPAFWPEGAFCQNPHQKSFCQNPHQKAFCQKPYQNAHQKAYLYQCNAGLDFSVCPTVSA